MKLKENENQYLQNCLTEFKADKLVQTMQDYTQHGNTTTFSHCERVASCSYWIVNRLRLKIDRQSMIRGAFLHDFYLYDWRTEEKITRRRHGLDHPASALNNACSCFELNTTEKNIIASHMWPLTITKIPRTREAFIVSCADKFCAMVEAYHYFRAVKIAAFLNPNEI